MFFRSFLVFIALISFSVTSFSQSKRKVELSCKQISPIQQSYLFRHIKISAETKALENRVKKQFIKRLDPSKFYLLQKDVKKINKIFDGLFVKIRSRDCSPIKQAYSLFVKRLDERTNTLKRYLGSKNFKFNKQTKITSRSDKDPFFKTQRKAVEFHKKYLQFQIANYIATDSTESKARDNVSKSYDRLKRRTHKLKDVDLWSMYLDAFASSLDPHSSYFSKEILENFEISFRLSLEGIGAVLSSKDGFTVIDQLVPGGVAHKSNKLRPKDKIIAVGQGDFGKLDLVTEMELNDVVRKIRGKKGTKVRLSILRQLGRDTKRFKVVLVRDKIKLEDQAASIYYIEKKVKRKKILIGVLNLPSFYTDNRRNGRSSAKDVKRLLREARSKGVDGIILDLSQNGGGSLGDAVKITGLFIKTGNIVKQSSKNSAYVTFRDKDSAVDYAGPLVILTSRVSASASEIVGGALSDYKRAIIVGGKSTYGKGSVQNLEPLHLGLGALKTTIGMFFTAGGYSTQRRGVKGDVVFPSLYSKDVSEGNLDYSLPPQKVKSFLSKEAYVKSGKDSWKIVTSRIIQKLRGLSVRRVSKNKEFKEIIKEKKKILSQGKTIFVSKILAEEAKEKEKNKENNKDRDEKGIISKVKKREKYLKQPEIKESINVLADLIRYQ